MNQNENDCLELDEGTVSLARSKYIINAEILLLLLL
jgi:hypothetical protein